MPSVAAGAVSWSQRRLRSIGPDDRAWSRIGVHDVMGAVSRVLHGVGHHPLDRRDVTIAVLDRVGQEHRRGRRLLVTTTDPDARRGVIRDMGVVAASAAPDRPVPFRQMLLASASVTGAFPRVLIDGTAEGYGPREMHVDGGAIGKFFVLPRAMPAHGAHARTVRARRAAGTHGRKLCPPRPATPVR